MALAYDTYGGHNLKYGVGNYGASNQHYWIASSASEFESSIDKAMSEWIYTTSYWGITTPISYTQTTVQNSSRMDIRQISSIPNWWAYTYFFNGSAAQNPETGDWVWGRIDLAGDFASCPKLKGAIAHEMGHVMGLAHVSSGTALMRWDINAMSTRAQPDDLNGINYLY